MASLLELSHELLHCIFLEIEPIDIAALRLSCRDLYSYLDNNRLLYKELYARCYDAPSLPPSSTEPDWDLAIQNVVKLDKLLAASDRSAKDTHLKFIADEISTLVANAAVEPVESRNIQLLQSHFDHAINRDSLLNASSLFDVAGTPDQRIAADETRRQASAKLHCLYGVPIDGYEGLSALLRRPADFTQSPSSSTRSRTKDIIPPHMVARGKIYDLREYTDKSLWGPFMGDGSLRVDWEKVEAVMVVLGFNLRKFNERSGGRFPMVWDEPFDGATPGSYVAPKVPAIDRAADEELEPKELALRKRFAKLDKLDPYGVSGTWMRIVCFLDFVDLSRYNFGEDDEEPQWGPIDTEEAIRLIRIKLQVTKVEPPGAEDEYEDDDGEPDMDWSGFTGTRLPTVHFEGTSRSLHASWDPNANSRIRGTVRQTPENEIRWTTFSIFHGEERWRSEGIQVGGVRSARGVLGNWFDKNFSPMGPAGPTAFWKECDELDEEKAGGAVGYF